MSCCGMMKVLIGYCIGSIFIRYILLSENFLRYVSDIGMMPLKFNMFIIFNVSYEIV